MITHSSIAHRKVRLYGVPPKGVYPFALFNQVTHRGEIEHMSSAKLVIDEKEFELRVVEGTEGEKALDITSLRSATGYITLDPGYANTGSCESAITFIDGEKGILRYRGYPIEELAGGARFPEVCHPLSLIHISEPTRLLSISYAVFCLKKKKYTPINTGPR